MRIWSSARRGKAARGYDAPARPAAMFANKGSVAIGFLQSPRALDTPEKMKFLDESGIGQTAARARSYRPAGVTGMRILSSNPERPMCPTCKHRMGLARISPGERGFELRSFECSTCHRLEKISIAVDPLKTDALGWLAGELRPPR